MQETEHYKLKKPAATDFYNVQDGNDGADKIDEALHGLRTDHGRHVGDAEKHIGAGEREAWNAKETTAGAQGKADRAEANAKAASRPVGWTPTAAQVGADPAGSAAAALTAAKQDATTKANKAEQNAKDASEKAGAVAAHDTEPTSHIDIRNALAATNTLAAEAKSIAEGRSRAVSYATNATLVAAVNIMSKTAMRVGDNLLIEAVGVPDLWVCKVEGTAVVYPYTTDAALEAALENGPVQMGYYKLSMLETPKVDLSGYVTKATTINGKALTGNITLTAGDVGARPATWLPTPADIGLGKTLTFTGAATGTYDGTTAKTVNIPEAGGKRTCRFVVGTSTAGWTAKDCDYLCDGTDDQVEINAAIEALPAGGGEVVVLDGTYNITAAIAVNKDNTKLSGNGAATVLKRMWNSSIYEGVIIVTAANGGCTVADLSVDGNGGSNKSTNNCGIYLSISDNNTITGNTCNNNCYGIYVNTSNNTITGNTCNNSGRYGIYVKGSNNTIAGNTCSSNIYVGAICVNGSNNTITGNTCNNYNNLGIEVIGSNNTITGNTCNNNSSGINVNSGNGNTITGNTCNNNSSTGIALSLSNNNTITGNTCNNNRYGIYVTVGNNNTITGNTAMRGTGQASDYTSTQYTIWINSASYNLIADNNIMGKNYAVNSGTGNTFVNNKYN